MKIFGIEITEMDSWSGKEIWVEEFKTKAERNAKYKEYTDAAERSRAKAVGVPETYWLYRKVFKRVK